jgi:ATP-binding cassette subfamily B (MDR/TAP) protein 1
VSIAFARASAAANKAFAVIDREPHIARSGVEVPASVSGYIGISNVRFTYPSRPDVQVLRGASIKIQPGGVTALVGGSGSGKSTILQLLLRFYEPDSGTITLDGTDIIDLDLRWLRQNIGFLPQEPHLYSLTIRENVLLGLPTRKSAVLSRSELDALVLSACMKAHAHDFIKKLPDGYETNVGERGSLLSGGESPAFCVF